jgi:hypothetical protein
MNEDEVMGLIDLNDISLEEKKKYLYNIRCL